MKQRSVPTPVRYGPLVSVLVAVNREYEQLARRPRDQLVGRNVFEVLPGDAAGANARHWRAALEWVVAERQPYVMPWTRYELPAPDRPGHSDKRFWSTVNAPLLGPDGEVSLIMHRVEDITAFIEQLGEPPSTTEGPARFLEIEGEVYARSSELQEVNRQLRNARADKHHAIQALRETLARQQQEVADASHDLRNPLTGLQTRLEEALADPDVDSHRVLQAALQDAERLGDIVSDLLELARLDAGAPIGTEPLEICRLIRDLLGQRPCRHTLDVHLDHPAVVDGSRSRLIRLLANLLDNAERHARTRIEVSATIEQDRDTGQERDTGQAIVRIIDDGPGIPAGERETVFQRFYRRPDARRADPHGTGLGLAISRQIAETHHGTLDIADHPTGTCMVLRLPLSASID
ncbi:sensor histidine kinase [Actinomadura opuntiae]|uniref:sensor histidine kinase n=1 Tax=Actinomadura sp. OS1-43 TaxID=604315 RepID=UPI00255AACA5|nr:PAS domain-containing sensor histidine kinase [Actinomadura sp. OS1-43]MDL4813101.1 ATP-binding protein [Actinomadura sp. OS1-43]